ncbi:MAG TPA: hypothetical protein VM425_12155 [Myxococcota bacterium]|nr:hypothetical protein [Myxococcota bacterium]
MSTTDDGILEEELVWFEANKAELLRTQPEKWAAVQGNRLLGVFDTFPEAFEKGSELANSTTILVRHIVEHDTIFQAPAFFLGLS